MSFERISFLKFPRMVGIENIPFVQIVIKDNYEIHNQKTCHSLRLYGFAHTSGVLTDLTVLSL